MAIASKVLGVTPRNTMLDSVFNPAGDEIFVAQNTLEDSRGESTAGNLYNAAGTGAVALTANVVINVLASSTGANGVTRIVYDKINDQVNAYYLSPTIFELFARIYNG